VFTDKAEGHILGIGLAASDDFRQRDDFRDAGTVKVIGPHEQPGAAVPTAALAGERRAM